MSGGLSDTTPLTKTAASAVDPQATGLDCNKKPWVNILVSSLTVRTPLFAQFQYCVKAQGGFCTLMHWHCFAGGLCSNLQGTLHEIEHHHFRQAQLAYACSRDSQH